jgi:hypothetical protein
MKGKVGKDRDGPDGGKMRGRAAGKEREFEFTPLGPLDVGLKLPQIVKYNLVQSPGPWRNIIVISCIKLKLYSILNFLHVSFSFKKI